MEKQRNTPSFLGRREKADAEQAERGGYFENFLGPNSWVKNAFR
jgi:hypothetical protein